MVSAFADNIINNFTFLAFMKVAIIDHLCKEEDEKGDFQRSKLQESLQAAGIEADIASSLDVFEAKFGPLNDYVGVLLHPGVKQQIYTLRTLNQKYPNIKQAIFSRTLDEYFFDGTTEIIGYNMFDKIKEFMSRDCK
jgi:hypothetical protein